MVSDNASSDNGGISLRSPERCRHTSAVRRLGDDEAFEFLSAGRRTGKVSVVRRSGSPFITPVWFIVEDGLLFFITSEDSVKGHAIKRDPRVCLLADLEEPPYGYVRADGHASIVTDDPAEMLEIAIRIARRYVGEEKAASYGRRNAAPGEILVRLRPHKVAGFTGLTDL
jgi:PPOX class probable F420-dependent enzyme